LKSGDNPLSNALSLELCKRGQNMELQLAGGGCAVDALTQTDERHADMLKLFEHRDEVTEIPSEPVQTPAHQHIEAPTLGVLQESIEGRPFVLRSTYTTVHELGPSPATSLNVTAKFLKLILWLLVECRDACIDGGPHERASVWFVPALRIWSAAFKMRCADFSGMGLPCPHHD
jgi:hypothetical protein